MKSWWPWRKEKSLLTLFNNPAEDYRRSEILKGILIRANLNPAAHI